MSCDAEFTRRYELIQSGLAVVSELEERTETEGSSASSCEQCGLVAETRWTVQAGTPAGKYLDLSDSETAELCDECMQKVVDSIRGETDADSELTKGGEYGR